MGFAGTAAAQDPASTATEPRLTHAAEQCIEILEEGGTADECHQAPDPLFPPWQEIAWSVVGFSVVVFLGWRWGIPPIRKSLANRSERIRSELETAEHARREAEQVRARYAAQLVSADDEVAAIITAGREHAVRLRIEMARAMQTEMATTREKATAEIEAARVQALGDVQAEVSRLIVQVTDHVVRSNLTPEVQAALVEKYIETLSSPN
jgi:ATP synthase F0 subunit b